MVKASFVSKNIAIILIVALAHTLIHYSMFSNGFIAQNGISGFSITEVNPDSPSTFSLSLLIIGFEWATLIFMVVFSLTREKITTGPEVKINIDKERMRKIAASGTEIDMLYELIKSNSSLRLSSAEKLFEVDKEKVLSWSKTLVDANLIKINYPNIGEPELVLK